LPPGRTDRGGVCFLSPCLRRDHPSLRGQTGASAIASLRPAAMAQNLFDQRVACLSPGKARNRDGSRRMFGAVSIRRQMSRAISFISRGTAHWIFGAVSKKSYTLD
jgi:hypothetical protein